MRIESLVTKMIMDSIFPKQVKRIEKPIEEPKKTIPFDSHFVSFFTNRTMTPKSNTSYQESLSDHTLDSLVMIDRMLENPPTDLISLYKCKAMIESLSDIKASHKIGRLHHINKIISHYKNNAGN